MTKTRKFGLVLLNDDVHTVEQVILTLMETFQYPRSLAEDMVKEIGEQGNSLIDIGEKDEVEDHMTRLLKHNPPFQVEVHQYSLDLPT